MYEADLGAAPVQPGWPSVARATAYERTVTPLVADRVSVMYLGKVVEQGPTEQIFDASVHGYTRALLSAALDLSVEP